MASRSLPNLGLIGFFDLGEDGWDDEMSLNLLKLSVLVQGRALSKVAAEPETPTDGDIHILDETHATNPNEVAIRDAGAWVYVEPLEGWLLYNVDAGYYEKFDGTVWAELATGGGTSLPDLAGHAGEFLRVNATEDGVEWVAPGGGLSSLSTVVATDADDYTVAPADVDKYIRLTGATAKVITIDPEATTALPANGEWHFRNAGAGDATVTPGSGVTVSAPAGGTLVIPEGGTATLKRVAADTFDLFGVTVAA